MGNKIQTRDIKHSKTNAWEIDCNSLTLEEALKILNPDNYSIYRMAEKRGAYKRIVIELDNANPSEALNGLEFICKILNEKRIDVKWLFKNEYTTIKQALLKAQKEHKALEIIKEKDVDVCELKIYIDEYDDSLYQYNKRMNIKRFKLTEEEFNLLKEVLE